MGPTKQPAETLACRCEEITLEDVARALAAGAVSLNDVKRRTRAGMGLCQGVYCMPAIAALVAQATESSIDRVIPMTARPPVRPIMIESLASVSVSKLDSGVDDERADDGD